MLLDRTPKNSHNRFGDRKKFFRCINAVRLAIVSQSGRRKEEIFWQNTKKLNGFGKLIEEGNAGKKEKSWQLRPPGEKRVQLLKHKMK